MLAREFRRIRLDFIIRLRRMGGWPWLVLVGWILFCASQEPRILRSFGIHLCWQGGWSGAAVVLFALTGLGPEHRGESSRLRQAVSTLASALLLTAVVDLGFVGLTWAVDLSLGAPVPPAEAALRAAGFWLAWLPTAVAAGALWDPAAVLGFRLMALAAPLFSMGASALWFTGPTGTTASACLLATIGAVGLVGAAPRAR